MRIQLLTDERFVSGVDGVHIYTKTMGTWGNPTLVFSHGGLLSSDCWSEPLLQSLSQHFFLVLWDLPGHGASDKPPEEAAYQGPAWAQNLRAVLEAFDLTTGLVPVVLVGWSFGAAAIRGYLQGWGQKGLAGLIFIAPFLDIGILSFLDKEAGEIMMGVPSSDTEVSNTSALRFVTELLTLSPLPMNAVRRLYGDACLVPRMPRGTMIFSLPTGGLESMQSLALPVLYIQGDQDRLTPLAYSLDRSQQICTSNLLQFRIYAECGHMPFREHTDKFIADLEEWAHVVAQRK